MSEAIALAERVGLRPGRKRADCPCCGYKAAIAILPGKNGRSPRLWCANGCDQNDLTRAAGMPAREGDPQEAADAEKKRERALALWSGSYPCTGTPAELYLRRRGLADLSRSAALRFRPDCPHPEGGRLQAMIAAVTDAAGRLLGVHRTYLTRDGRKADVEPVKASLGPVWSSAI